MAILKIKQKLGLDCFKVLYGQIRAGDVCVVDKFKGGEPNPGKMFATVKNAFNLGNKIEVELDKVIPVKDGYSFKKSGDKYYLVAL